MPMERKYVIVLANAGRNWSGYAPDLPGLGWTGANREECEANAAAAIEFHLEGLRRNGDAVPEPASEVSSVLIAA